MKLKIAAVFALSLAMLQSAYADVKYVTYNADSTELRFNKDTGEIEKSSKPSALGKDSSLPTRINPVSLTIPDTIEGKSVLSTGTNSFCDYDDLVSVTLPKTLEVLGDYSFAGCDSIKTVTVPSGVKKISKGCFTLCDVLETVSASGAEEVAEKAFAYSKKLKTFDTSNVEKIGSSAFESCESLESVDLSSLTQIDASAFKGCKSLTQATFGKSLKSISANAFAQTGLVSVKLGDNLTEIKQNAFQNCKSLESITIPSSVKKIDKTSFSGCDSLVIYCDKGSTAETYASANGIACRTDTKSPERAAEVITNVGYIRVTIDGQYLELSQKPENINGSVLVPMRPIFESLGAEIQWNPSTRTVTAKKGADSISCTIDMQKAYVNGKIVQLTAPARLINGTTMVPIRFVSEALGAKVSWDSANQTVIITTK